MDPAHARAHQRLWTDLTRHAQPGYIAAPASLLAFTAWQNGNGALANLALDRALADTPRLLHGPAAPRHHRRRRPTIGGRPADDPRRSRRQLQRHHPALSRPSSANPGASGTGDDRAS